MDARPPAHPGRIRYTYNCVMPLTTGISFGNLLSLAQRETLAHQTSSQGFSLELKGDTEVSLSSREKPLRMNLSAQPQLIINSWYKSKRRVNLNSRHSVTTQSTVFTPTSAHTANYRFQAPLPAIALRKIRPIKSHPPFEYKHLRL